MNIYMCMYEIKEPKKKRISKIVRNAVHDLYFSFRLASVICVCVQIITWQLLGCCTSMSFCFFLIVFFILVCANFCFQLVSRVTIYISSSFFAFVAFIFIVPSFSCDLSMILEANCTHQ